jgi:hypothetical protein
LYWHQENYKRANATAPKRISIPTMQSMARRTAAPPVESIISVDKKKDNNRSKL